MIVIPSIDLEAGRGVKRVEGRSGTGLRDRTGPVERARRWRAAGARRLHLIDLDAAEGRGGNAALVSAIIGTGNAPVQVGGGIRSIEDVRAALAAGADRVVLSTAVWKAPEWGESVVRRFGERVGFAIDVRSDRLVVRGWVEAGPTFDQALDWISRSEVRWIVYTDVLREGSGAGIGLAGVERVRSVFDKELLVAGGIAARAELVQLAARGVDGAIVGRALYDGSLPTGTIAEVFE
jgi:phosphoribosylformimino-5-aminoimidazole carboxamide ribotide isomerase